MATKVILVAINISEKNPKLIALSYYFPETTFVRSNTTEILISHCFNIVTDRSNTNTNRLSQF